MSKFHAWLQGELGSWLSEGLIDSEQAEVLRRRYPVTDGLPWGRLVLSAIGAIVFGLGVILFFAYNWQDMPKVVKLGVVIGGLIAIHGSGALLAARKRGSPALIEACHMLGTMLFGAGIWLVSQIYHLDRPYPDAFLVWGLGALVMAWALPSIPQGMVALVLIGSWSFDTGRYFVAETNFLAPALVLLGGWGLAAHLRSKLLSFAAAATFLLVLPMGVAPVLKDLVGFLLVCVTVIYIAAGLHGRAKGWDWMRAPAALGMSAYCVLLFIASFPDILPDFVESPPTDPTQWALFWLPLALALITLVAAWRADGELALPEKITLGLAAAALGYSMLLVLGIIELRYTAQALPFSLLLLAHGVVAILDGAHRQSWQRATGGSLAVAVVTFARFADLFESLLMRSLAFLILGAGIFAVGHYYQKQKRHSRDRREQEESSEAEHA